MNRKIFLNGLEKERVLKPSELFSVKGGSTYGTMHCTSGPNSGLTYYFVSGHCSDWGESFCRVLTVNGWEGSYYCTY